MLGIPSNIEQIQGFQGIFAPGGALHKTLINKILEALGEYEPDAVHDIKNEKAADSVDSVLQYLQPTTVEALAKTRHDEIRR